MKKIILFGFVLIVNILTSQELKTTPLLPPASKEHTDLHFLNDELKGKRLVMLGEMTHMYGNIFEMKTRIVEYLHKELGYTTIAMESSMYDIWLMNKEGFSVDKFNDVIWGVWSSTQEFQRLVKYIEANHIKVIGFDSQVNDSSRFLEDFFDYLENSNIELLKDEDDLAIAIEGVLENFSFEEDDITFKDFEKEMHRIIKRIAKLKQTDTNYHWLQFTKSLLTTAKDAYYNKNEIETTAFGTQDHNFRDAQMADNLLSYLARNPNEKVIVWADNIHIINNLSSIKKPILKEFISMGTHIKKALRNEVYSLATLHANDSILDQKKWYPTPIQKGSFEAQLDSLNKPYLFISSNQEAMKKIQQSRLLDFVDFTEMNLSELHDGYIFLRHAALPKNEVTVVNDEETAQEDEEIAKETKPIASANKSVVKVQVIDAETKMPIPYATVIMKKEEIYRIADEDGFFQLPITKKIMQTASIDVSSMGFKSQTIKVNNLSKIIKLSPKFQELDEVVIKGYTSPKTVLKKAIGAVKLNHPIAPHNYERYSTILINKDDQTLLDLELITKDYDEGYTSPYIITRRIEQIKWNKSIHRKNYKYSSQFFSYRQNAIRYSNILHKRKYKKFNLTFIQSKRPEDEGLYIIEFKTDRNKWNYTNRGYPTQYSGKVYIRRYDFTIFKVVENWTTTLNQEEIKTYLKDNHTYKAFAKKKQIIIKEENTCEYAAEINDKNYASNYFRRIYVETLDNNDKLENATTEISSNLYHFETKNVEEIEYEFDKKKLTVLKRVRYDADFWNSFYKQYPNFLTN